MANNMKSIRIVSVLVCALVISLALVLYGTLSQLQDSKTATGTVTFDLADYDLQLSTTSLGVLAAPGQTNTSNIIQLINTSKADDKGTIVGMGGVYIKMVITGVTVNGSSVGDVSVSAREDINDGGITVIAGEKFTIELITDAGTVNTDENLTWAVENGGIYLKTTGTGAPLPFTPRSGELSYANAADIQFRITMKDPNINNGFNGSGNPIVNNNELQGKPVAINYTLYWATTLNEDGSFPTIQNNN